MKILVIEDHAPLLCAIKQGLEESGCTVDVATEGHDGDAKARSGDYEAIVLDLMLPHIDGLTLLKNWRRDQISHPVLVLTARSTVGDRILGLDAGADDYLTKPFGFEELLARLRALARRQRAVVDNSIRICDLEIDPLARLVKRAGKEINLTRREYSLLHLLAMNRGRVVTRETIWEHIYNDEQAGASNVVDVFVRHLRAKIDKGFERPLIVTHWGQGYELIAGDAPSAVK